MRLGILEVGHCNAAMAPKHGLYPPLFQTLIGRADPSVSFHGYRVLEGVFPADAAECDGWLITGSKSGVYDPEPWIPPTQDLIRDAYARRVPLIGVCFGHQLMAHSLGGRAEKSEKGWGTGAHSYELFDDPGWFGARPAQLSLHAMHQDQVVAAPPDSRLLARSDFCAYAALAYGPGTETHAISIQPHPEFDADFERDLILSRRGRGLPDGVADAALASLGGPTDADPIADWFVAFLRAASRSPRRPGAT